MTWRNTPGKEAMGSKITSVLTGCLFIVLGIGPVPMATAQSADGGLGGSPNLNAVIITPDKPYSSVSGGRLSVRFAVHNEGPIAVSEYRVNVTMVSPSGLETDAARINARQPVAQGMPQHHEVDLPLDVSIPGIVYRFCIVTDPFHAIPESNETDNRVCMPFMIADTGKVLSPKFNHNG